MKQARMLPFTFAFLLLAAPARADEHGQVPETTEAHGTRPNHEAMPVAEAPGRGEPAAHNVPSRHEGLVDPHHAAHADVEDGAKPEAVAAVEASHEESSHGGAGGQGREAKPPAAHGEEDPHGQIAEDRHGQDEHEIHPTAHESAHASEREDRRETEVASDGKTGPVVAMDARKGTAVRAGSLVTAGSEPAVFIGRRNQRVELSPRTVAEFDEQGALRLLRGSAVAESRDEAVVRTSGARLDFVGKALVSYDHVEKSTSAFVLEGEARLVNAHRNDSSLRLPRFRGATMVVGEVLPQLIRQLDVGAVQSWLKGYSWPEARRDQLLKEMPGGEQVAKSEAPKHLEQAKIEDYFSSIETADEFHQPDLYDKKFDDPDKVVAEQNSKQGAGKVLSPEEAALISLPKTQIDLGFELGPEFLTPEQKTREVRRIGAPEAKRSPASAHTRKAAKKALASEQHGDPDVNAVLNRLRQVRGASAEYSVPAQRSRAPASVSEPVIADPVYDYSQNF